MNNFLIMALIVGSAVIAIILLLLFWLFRAQAKLKRDYQTLRDSIHVNGNDIAGLCAAALGVDSRIAAVDKRISITDGLIDDLAAKISEMEEHYGQAGMGSHDQADHSYSVDINRVRSGASIDELMHDSGLSHDEAALLVRLHGGRGNR
ncbi:MAG: DUF2802 domain-containing protein [Methylobacter sp.]|nr:DUF2802 domain-containing protein [Methylobacter sp.]MDP2099872.1 DUF2802 domain-containing protein [Methylobacter sp.]MDP2429291.1 DUF2802 domain-containing protein [Methylobacter sp.]MDP3053199.1 DUF2802 domain-containing protein [Methylobacter sp.]MDP3361856.1 DUF2802 domain-containing protein [Methylobacter sp.]